MSKCVVPNRIGNNRSHKVLKSVKIIYWNKNISMIEKIFSLNSELE